MSDRTIEDQLTKYLADVHSIEVHALAQMKAAPKLAGEGRLAEAIREHHAEKAQRADDPETAAVAERILFDERRAAERIAATWDAAVDATLSNLVASGAR